MSITWRGPTTYPHNSATLHFGNLPGEAYGGETFSGEMDEIRIWDVARTQIQTQANRYEKFFGEPGLVGYYRCDDGSGSTLKDETARGNHGTLMNMTTPWTVAP